MIQVYIPHGGAGSRVADVRWPKGAVDINGRPFVALQLEQLERLGVDQVVLRLQSRWPEMMAAIGQARLGRMEITVHTLTQEQLIEVPQALIRVAPILAPEFVVLQGDVYPCCYPSQLLRMLDYESAGVMTCADAGADNNVTTRHGRVVAVHDQCTANAHDCGMYAFRRECVQEARMATTWADFMHHFVGRLAVHEVANRPHEVGRAEGIRLMRAAEEFGEL